MRKKRVLIGSPIRQKAAILKEFLSSLNKLEEETYISSFVFVDDNNDEEASILLQEFKSNHYYKKVKIIKPEMQPQDNDYICDQNTHYWKTALVEKVAEYKNIIIKEAIENKYDYLFLIDSDLIINPNLIEHLIGVNKDIVSDIFWTMWASGTPLLPNVWISDQYTMYEKGRGEEISYSEIAVRMRAFIDKLKTPGTYEVGGLGACTLISKKALKMGVNFNMIENLSFWGEDRHFCIRACALGIKLFVDTHYPAYHIYRESDLIGVDDYREKGISNLEQCHNQKNSSSQEDVETKNQEDIETKNLNDIKIKDTNNIDTKNLATGATQKSQIVRYYKEQDNKLTLSMVIKNEADRYLEKALNEISGCIDEAVIIDDGSEDNSVEICRNILKGIPLKIIQNKESRFSNEIELRKQQWEETIKTNPDWILNLDADEIFEKRFYSEVRGLINQKSFDAYCFRLYDFWNESSYRDDECWFAHKTYRPFLIRYQKEFEYKWKETSQHCGRFPANILLLPNTISDLRLKHFGWAQKKDRINKYNRYRELDPDSKLGWKAQYDSILDGLPNLIRWEE